MFNQKLKINMTLKFKKCKKNIIRIPPSPSPSPKKREDSSDVIAPGGYCKIRYKQILHSRYEIQKKLGHGYFSTVWLAKDLIANKLVAVKVQKSEENYASALLDEQKIVRKLHRHNHDNCSFVINATDFFSLPSAFHVHEKHHCMVFDLMWKDLYYLIERFNNGIPFAWLKIICYQIVRGMEHLHRCGVIHTDLKPENILISNLKDVPFLVKIADLGNACYTKKHFTHVIQTRQYRSPEAILYNNYSTSTDMFSVGVTLLELATGKQIFNPPHGDYRNEKHLALMMQYLGPVPHRMIKQARLGKHYFTSRGTLRHVSPLRPKRIVDLFDTSFAAEEAIMFSDLIEKLLCIDPYKRLSAHEALRHKWFHDIHVTYKKKKLQTFKLPITSF